MKKNDLLKELRDGRELTRHQQLYLTVQLSLPAIMAQISTIFMQYIDASMVGHLGANASASIGIISSTTWLMGGLCTAAATGFTVQVAHKIGANREMEARNIVKEGFLVALFWSALLMLIGLSISGSLPVWLGGDPAICGNATTYFRIIAMAIPCLQMIRLAGGMLQCSGDMRIPSILNVMMCVLDVILNAFLIFKPGELHLAGIALPGAGLGVIGAALGTALSEAIVALLLLYFMLGRSSSLRVRRGEAFAFHRLHLKEALRIGIPVGIEQSILCGAQIVSTSIVAPLGTIAIAANSFGVTAESLCYMPGYGIGTASTTLIGQSIGAKRRDLTRRLGWMTTLLGMAVMTGSGILMYIFAPWMIGFLSPDPEICLLGTRILRIEAFAEPLYGASIVANGVFRGAGDTFMPSIMNFSTMWAIRLPLAAFLSRSMGLKGVWIAMCIELCCRGLFFLLRLWRGNWEKY